MKRSILILIGLFSLLATPLIGHAQECKLKVYGDFRGRYEGFRFSEDESGEAKKPRRSRLRYRFRLNVSMSINSRSRRLTNARTSLEPGWK